jgi:hypothetical protein
MPPFNAAELDRLKWRQGSVLGPRLLKLATEMAPPSLQPALAPTDWLVITTHDCDVLNESLEKEPSVELLRTTCLPGKLDTRQGWGRQPRSLQLPLDVDGAPYVLSCRVHDRWTIPRDLLLQEPPARQLAPRPRRLIAEWLAKRYTRPAFPTAFDLRWRQKAPKWAQVLDRHEAVLAGVFLRLNTYSELPPDSSYRIDIIAAVHDHVAARSDWPSTRDGLDKDISLFWSQFSPSIELDGVDPRSTLDVSLYDLTRYLRFDADWISFEHDAETLPPQVDLTA